jgi:hypothetical protein
MQNLLVILALVTASLQKYGPALVAAEQAFAKGGWAGLETWLLQQATTPTAGAPRDVLQQLLDDARPHAQKALAG